MKLSKRKLQKIIREEVQKLREDDYEKRYEDPDGSFAFARKRGEGGPDVSPEELGYRKEAASIANEVDGAVNELSNMVYLATRSNNPVQEMLDDERKIVRQLKNATNVAQRALRKIRRVEDPENIEGAIENVLSTANDFLTAIRNGSASEILDAAKEFRGAASNMRHFNDPDYYR